MTENHDRPVPREDLLFDVEMALRRAERVWPKGHRAGRHDRFRPAALVVVDQLVLCGLRFFRKPPLGGHKTPDPDLSPRGVEGGYDAAGDTRAGAVRAGPSRGS